MGHLYEPRNARLSIAALLDLILRYCIHQKEPPEGRLPFNAARTFIHFRPSVPAELPPSAGMPLESRKGDQVSVAR
jgi:hypothetical protein